MDQDDFLGGCIAELKTKVKHQKAACDEAKGNLVLHDVIQGQKDIGDVPLKDLANVKKVLEKCMEEAINAIKNNLMVS
jgi:hypothetical protein